MHAQKQCEHELKPGRRKSVQATKYLRRQVHSLSTSRGNLRAIFECERRVLSEALQNRNVESIPPVLKLRDHTLQLKKHCISGLGLDRFTSMGSSVLQKSSHFNTNEAYFKDGEGG